MVKPSKLSIVLFCFLIDYMKKRRLKISDRRFVAGIYQYLLMLLWILYWLCSVSWESCGSLRTCGLSSDMLSKSRPGSDTVSPMLTLAGFPNDGGREMFAGAVHHS